MTSKTRNFAVASLIVLGAGLGTGLFAYYTGFSTSAIAPTGGPDELKYLPSNATLVAFADVHEVMTSEVRQKVQSGLPFHGQGQRSFEDQTGINIETDIDRVVFGLTPLLETGQQGVPSGLVVARGRFNAVKIESFMRDRGARVEEYKGKRIVTADHPHVPSVPDSSQPQQQAAPSRASESVSIAFIEPGLMAVGQSALVRRSIDLKDGGDSVVANEEVMNRVHALSPGNVWAVGRFDALTSQARLPTGVMGQLPAINWFSVSGQVDSGLAGTLQAETRDEESANGLRDVVRGFVALAKMQTGSQPELQPLLQTLQLGGSGKMVRLSFDLSPQLLDLLARSARKPSRPNL
jgi:hypothetical protein